MTDLVSGFGPPHSNHVWSCDFVEGRTHNGGKFHMLNIIDAFTRERLMNRIAHMLDSTDGHGRPVGPVYPAQCAGPWAFRQWAGVHRQSHARVWIVPVGAKTAFIKPGNP